MCYLCEATELVVQHNTRRSWGSGGEEPSFRATSMIFQRKLSNHFNAIRITFCSFFEPLRRTKLLKSRQKMHLAPVNALIFMCYMFFLYFSSLSRRVRTPPPPQIRHCVIMLMTSLYYYYVLFASLLCFQWIQRASAPTCVNISSVRFIAYQSMRIQLGDVQAMF